MKITLSIVCVFVLIATVSAQNVANRSAKFSLDTKKPVNSTVPVISWATPIPEITYVQSGAVSIKFIVETTTPIKIISISIRESLEAASRGTQVLKPEESQKLYTVVEKRLNLEDGDNVIEVIAENVEGVKTKTHKIIRVGTEALANAGKLERTDYALVFATDQYDNWPDLVNPIFDSRTISEELKNRYGYNVDIVENPTQDEILRKLREYAEKKYKPLDQLLIFFAGHGSYDQTFGEGFVVTKESLANDEGKTSYLSHNRLRSIINNIPSEHIFLVMDVCFGGTFDEALASARGLDDNAVYKEQDQNQFISRKLTMKTRRYLTSGGKTYVSDGIAGQHSPFARKFIDALQSQGGTDGILTNAELFGFVEKLKIQAKQGVFGDNLPGSDFLFVLK
jgi:hypothetical protein